MTDSDRAPTVPRWQESGASRHLPDLGRSRDDKAVDTRTDCAGLGVFPEAGPVLCERAGRRGPGPGARPDGPVEDRGQQTRSGRAGVRCG
jgi:hypothetical protein